MADISLLFDVAMGGKPAEDEEDDISVPIGKPNQPSGGNTPSYGNKVEGDKIEFDDIWEADQNS